MKGTFISLLLIICLSSCGNNISTDKNMAKPYVIISITDFEDGMCTYNVETGTDYIKYIDNLSIVDSVGKFNIGDTVYFTLNKK